MHKYQLIAKQGSGTFSEVFRVQHAEGQHAAIKCMKDRFASVDQVRRCVDLDHRIAFPLYPMGETIVYLDRFMHWLWCFPMGNWAIFIMDQGEMAQFPHNHVYSIIP